MRRRLDVGVIGAGEISRYHLDALSRLDDCNLRVIASRTGDRARDLARAYGVAQWSDDWTEVVRAGEVDAVVIATPAASHAEILEAAVASGVSTLVQKPLSTTASTAERLAATAQLRQVLVCVSFMHRYFPEVRALKAMIERGELGQIHSARVRNATSGPDWSAAYFRSPADPAELSGVLLELGVHGIDLVGHLLGPIREVVAMSGRSASQRRLAGGRTVPSEVDEQIHAVYQLDDGLLVTHEMDFNEIAGTDRFLVEVSGTSGSAAVRTAAGRLTMSVDRSDSPAWRRVPVDEEPLGVRQHQHFFDQVRGTAEADDTLHAAVTGLHVAEAVRLAAVTGRRQPVRTPAVVTS